MNAYQKRKASIREEAIEWQGECSRIDMSWGEIAYWNHYFTKQAKRYGLTREFLENGII